MLRKTRSRDTGLLLAMMFSYLGARHWWLAFRAGRTLSYRDSHASLTFLWRGGPEFV